MSAVGILVQQITGKLFEAEFRRLAQIVKTLDTHNRELSKLTTRGFMFKGKNYIPEGSQIVAMPLPSLTFQLWNQGDAYLKDMDSVLLDKATIEQMLTRLLFHCGTTQEIRDTLPECLIPLVPALASVPRVYAQGFWAPKDEMFKRQYEKILPKIEFYSATRLLY
ncbi:MAG: hypothetical protein WC117_00160 [Sphaerochaetaceae bacterium]|jgi:hypothetical protein